MDDTSINNAGLKPIRDVIEKHGSWNITNSNWSSESWKLESILGRALAEIEISAFIKLNVQPYVFNTSEWLVTVS